MSDKSILHAELCYEIVGCAYRVHRYFGSGHKESLYQEAFEQELRKAGLHYKREPNLRVLHPETKTVMRSTYRPDFLIDDKVVVEIKAVPKSPKYLIDQLYDYLRNSEYELGYLINFAELSLKPHRIIYTNDRKNL